MYASVVQLQRLAMTSGSPSSDPIASFLSAKISDAAPAAHPASAIAQRTETLGVREPLSDGASIAEALMPPSLLPCSCLSVQPAGRTPQAPASPAGRKKVDVWGRGY